MAREVARQTWISDAKESKPRRSSENGGFHHSLTAQPILWVEGWKEPIHMLSECQECHGQLSSKATSCPHCGCPVEAQSGEEMGPSAEDYAIASIVICLAGGMKKKDIHAQLKTGLPEHKLPPGAVKLSLITRIERWHRFYLEVFRRGWWETGLPPAQEIASEFFCHDLAETIYACRMCEAWVNAAYPKARLDELMTEATKSFVAGTSPNRIRVQLEQLPEPKRDIALATWYSRARSRLRADLDDAHNT